MKPETINNSHAISSLGVSQELLMPSDERLFIPSVNNWRWRVLCELDRLGVPNIDALKFYAVSHFFDDAAIAFGKNRSLYVNIRDEVKEQVNQDTPDDLLASRSSLIRTHEYLADAAPTINRVYRHKKEMHSSRNLEVELPKPRTFIEKLGGIAQIGMVDLKFDENKKVIYQLSNTHSLTPPYIRHQIPPSILGHMLALTQSGQLYETEHTNRSAKNFRPRGATAQSVVAAPPEDVIRTSRISSFNQIIDLTDSTRPSDRDELIKQFLMYLKTSDKSLKSISEELAAIYKLGTVIEQINFEQLHTPESI